MSNPISTVQAGNALTGVKRPTPGNPTHVPGGLPAFRGRSIQAAGPVKAPKLNQGNRPNRGTNISIPYHRVVPLEFLSAYPGRLSPGDVSFVAKLPPSYMSKAPSTAHQSMGRCLGIDGVNRLLHGATSPLGWSVGQNVLQVKSTESFYAKLYLSTPDTTTSKVTDAELPRSIFSLTELDEYRVDGIVHSNDEPGTFDSSGKRDSTIINTVISGPALVNNGFLMYKHADHRTGDERKVETHPRGNIDSAAHIAVTSHGNSKGTQWMFKGKSDFVAQFSGQYTAFPCQMFDRSVRTLDKLFVGLRAYEIKADIDSQYLLLEDIRNAESHDDLVKLFKKAKVAKGMDPNASMDLDEVAANEGVTVSWTYDQRAEWHRATVHYGVLGKLKNDEGDKDTSQFFFFQYMPFSSRDAWAQQRWIKKQVEIARKMAKVTTEAERDALLKERDEQMTNLESAYLLDNVKGARKSKFNMNPYDAIRTMDYCFMVGAWHIGRVLDTKAAKYDVYEGGPSDTSFALNVAVEVEFMRAETVPNGSDNRDDAMEARKAVFERRASPDQIKAVQIDRAINTRLSLRQVLGDVVGLCSAYSETRGGGGAPAPASAPEATPDDESESEGESAPAAAPSAPPSEPDAIIKDFPKIPTDVLIVDINKAVFQYVNSGGFLADSMQFVIRYDDELQKYKEKLEATEPKSQRVVKMLTNVDNVLVRLSNLSDALVERFISIEERKQEIASIEDEAARRSADIELLRTEQIPMEKGVVQELVRTLQEFQFGNLPIASQLRAYQTIRDAFGEKGDSQELVKSRLQHKGNWWLADRRLPYQVEILADKNLFNQTMGLKFGKRSYKFPAPIGPDEFEMAWASIQNLLTFVVYQHELGMEPSQFTRYFTADTYKRIKSGVLTGQEEGLHNFRPSYDAKNGWGGSVMTRPFAWLFAIKAETNDKGVEHLESVHPSIAHSKAAREDLVNLRETLRIQVHWMLLPKDKQNQRPRSWTAIAAQYNSLIADFAERVDSAIKQDGSITMEEFARIWIKPTDPLKKTAAQLTTNRHKILNEAVLTLTKGVETINNEIQSMVAPALGSAPQQVATPQKVASVGASAAAAPRAAGASSSVTDQVFAAAAAKRKTAETTSETPAAPTATKKAAVAPAKPTKSAKPTPTAASAAPSLMDTDVPQLDANPGASKPAARRRDRAQQQQSTVAGVFDSIFGTSSSTAAAAADNVSDPPASPTPSSGSENATGPATFKRKN